MDTTTNSGRVASSLGNEQAMRIMEDGIGRLNMIVRKGGAGREVLKGQRQGQDRVLYGER